MPIHTLAMDLNGVPVDDAGATDKVSGGRRLEDEGSWVRVQFEERNDADDGGDRQQLHTGRST
jgi:hypothetical protein